MAIQFLHFTGLRYTQPFPTCIASSSSSSSSSSHPQGTKPHLMIRASLSPKREKDPKKRVVITGMGVVSVFGNDVDTFYEKLLEGQSGVHYIEKFDTSSFPTKIAGEIKSFSSEGYIDGKNDRRLDDFIRYCLVASKKALQNASLTAQELNKVMESLEHAMKRGVPILAEYLGGSVTCDAYHIKNSRDDGLGASTCITNALKDAGVSIEEVNYINAHASSTRIGDSNEINAIKKVFKYHENMKINSTKSMIGHCLGASGALEAVATIKAINCGWLHPTINQHMIDPCVVFDTIANEKQQHDIDVAISNSFGFGGHNSVVVFAPFVP